MSAPAHALVTTTGIGVPDRLVGKYFKRCGYTAQQKNLLQKALRIMNRIAQWPERIRSYFQRLGEST